MCDLTKNSSSKDSAYIHSKDRWYHLEKSSCAFEVLRSSLSIVVAGPPTIDYGSLGGMAALSETSGCQGTNIPKSPTENFVLPYVDELRTYCNADHFVSKFLENLNLGIQEAIRYSSRVEVAGMLIPYLSRNLFVKFVQTLCATNGIESTFSKNSFIWNAAKSFFLSYEELTSLEKELRCRSFSVPPQKNCHYGELPFDKRCVRKYWQMTEFFTAYFCGLLDDNVLENVPKIPVANLVVRKRGACPWDIQENATAPQSFL